MKKKSLGFSLIEVLIAMTILATLGTLAARAISQGVKAKKRIQEQIDDVSKLRDAIKLIERDIQLAYHHQDWEQEIQDIINKKTGKSPTPAANPFGVPQSSTGATSADPTREVPRQDPTTFFIGSDNEINFVTMNQTRMSREAKQADYLEVGYSLKDCRSADGKSSSSCIWRRTSNIVDDDPTKGGDEIVLLENVTEFSLKYIGTGKLDWLKEWNTKTSPDAFVKNKFPLAVEVSIRVEKKTEDRGAKTKKYSLQIVAPIHFPNNKDEKPSSTTQGQPNGPGAPGAGTGVGP